MMVLLDTYPPGKSYVFNVSQIPFQFLHPNYNPDGYSSITSTWSSSCAPSRFSPTLQESTRWVLLSSLEFKQKIQAAPEMRSAWLIHIGKLFHIAGINCPGGYDEIMNWMKHILVPILNSVVQWCNNHAPTTRRFDWPIPVGWDEEEDGESSA